MSTEGRKSYTRPVTGEEERKLIKIASVAIASAITFMVVLALLIHFEHISLAPKDVKAESLRGFASRAEYAIRFQVLLVFNLLFNIFFTIYGRITTKAYNPLAEETEQHVELFKRILANSFEQTVLSVFTQLAFVSFAEPETVLKFIPYINIVQFVGRIAFFAGYPMHRAFGFNCTFTPTIILNVYNLYKFGSFIGLY